MRGEDFDFLSRTVRERSGLQLTQDKSYLLESRLMPVARRFVAKRLDEFVNSVRQRQDQERLKAITEAMTTNETLFFRDAKPFEQFKRVVLPALLEARAAQRAIRIWCAASSSGQEPYSLAMLIKEEGLRLAGWRFEILATDLSQEMVDRARAGAYSQFEVQRGLPIQLLMKYFRQIEDRWQLPQRADLFRPADQGAGARAGRQAAAQRRHALSRRRRDRARRHRPLRADAQRARHLPPGPARRRACPRSDLA